jgi:hypothetical protein
MRAGRAGPRSALLAACAVLVAATALAGCSGSGPREVEVAPGEIVTVTEAPKPQAGTVSGIVGDDALYPLANVQVTIVGLNMSATTKAGGQFAIVNVPAGIYILEGELKDHATTQTTVDVQPGKVARAVLLMARLPPSDPYHTTFKAEGFTEFGAGDINVLGDGNFTVEVQLDRSRPATIVAESKWDNLQTTDDQPLWFDLRTPAFEEIVSGPAANPFVTRIDPRILPPGRSLLDFEVRVKTLAPVVAAQSHDTSFVTVFYNQPAPDGWSVLAGSA